ncbi:outer membrane protein assembly factor BamE [Hyphococcus sp. DH-69]|uniref:outer membrane protein assembly factor BamE n=1 Tax=Hyphococcus formosus TaxID=3143534 RepID=UPI00398A89C5
MIRLILLALCLTTLQACVSVRSSHGYVLERDQESLTAKPGFDTKDSILAKYGEPSMIGVFDRNAWYYLHSTDHSRAFFKPETQTRTVTAIHFTEDGSVENFETYSLEDGEDIRLVQRETPTRGKTLNFWEQLLGNVGALPASLGEEGPTPGQ